MKPRSIYVNAGKFQLHVTEWGSPANPPLVMWHGLARTGRDFDEAATALAEHYFVLCPDTIGRGLSDWAPDPQEDYCFKVYGETAIAMLEHYGIERTRWVGTSMGGLIGVTLAAGPLRGRISHLVINDIGPDIPQAAVDRITAYVGTLPEFASIVELEAWLRQAYAPFGRNSDAFWRRMADTSYRRTDDGQITVHYDPRIVNQFTTHKSDLDLWDVYDSLDLPVLLLRGAGSDVLPQGQAEEMAGRGPKPKLEVLEGFGHAPTLASKREVGMLRGFLEE